MRNFQNYICMDLNRSKKCLMRAGLCLPSCLGISGSISSLLCTDAGISLSHLACGCWCVRVHASPGRVLLSVPNCRCVECQSSHTLLPCFSFYTDKQMQAYLLSQPIILASFLGTAFSYISLSSALACLLHVSPDPGCYRGFVVVVVYVSYYLSTFSLIFCEGKKAGL